MNISCAIINIKLVSLYASFAGNSVTISVQASLGSGLIDFIPTNLCLLLPKVIKPKSDKFIIQNKRDEIYKEIDKVNKSGLSEKKRNTQIQNLKNQLPKDNDDLSKEY